MSRLSITCQPRRNSYSQEIRRGFRSHFWERTREGSLSLASAETALRDDRNKVNRYALRKWLKLHIRRGSLFSLLSSLSDLARRDANSDGSGERPAAQTALTCVVTRSNSTRDRTVAVDRRPDRTTTNPRDNKPHRPSARGRERRAGCGAARRPATASWFVPRWTYRTKRIVNEGPKRKLTR